MTLNAYFGNDTKKLLILEYKKRSGLSTSNSIVNLDFVKLVKYNSIWAKSEETLGNRDAMDQLHS